MLIKITEQDVELANRELLIHGKCDSNIANCCPIFQACKRGGKPVSAVVGPYVRRGYETMPVDSNGRRIAEMPPERWPTAIGTEVEIYGL